MVKISLLEPNLGQPRKVFDVEELGELAESIKNYGILQPLLVQKKGDLYEIIAGERRFRAAKLAGLKEVPVIARSIDEVNVQRIMEELGGGGHINASGTQFEHTDMEEAVAALKAVIDKWIQKGDV